MSMIWRSAMPLLTTLAALVIIVHCIEEDMDTEYQHHLLTRLLDIEPRSTEESRRLLKETPIKPNTRDILTEYDNTPDDVPKRRRRKRKRRPQSDENFDAQDRYPYPGDPPRPFYDVDYVDTYKTTEAPKRRRKKQEDRPFRWVDEELMDAERPMRQKGGTRRKRPVETFPVISEFGQSVNNYPGDDKDKTYPDTNDNLGDLSIGLYPRGQENKPTNGNYNVKIMDMPDVKKDVAEDKSLSDFSMEIGLNMRAMKSNTPVASNAFETEIINPGVTGKSLPDNFNIPENGQLDPMTLKEILKRSNGTSLSEILQQHNLSLSDLLNGNEEAVSILKSQDSEEIKTPENEETNTRDKVEDEDIFTENKFVTEIITEYTTERENLIRRYGELETTTTTPVLQNLNKRNTTITERRYLIGLRKKLRMRPLLNVTNTRKMQLSKDLVALNGRKYPMLRRNRTKSHEWQSVIDSFRRNNTEKESSTTELQEETTTETVLPVETTTIPIEIETNNPSYEIRQETEDTKIEYDKESAPAPNVHAEIENDTDKLASDPKVIMRQNVAAEGTRPKAFNIKLKRKRPKHKNLQIETSDNSSLVQNKNVTSYKPATRVQTPRTLSDYDIQFNAHDVTTTTEVATNSEGPLHVKFKPLHQMTPKPTTLLNSTAKIEIEEILTDARIRDKLAVILKERNMTLSQLVDHRERGSSHVHLADIFHNASKEPNPPEPFLSKSLIEPISKETYPLRAILEANLHDSNSKLTNEQQPINIPVIMDYRNNVNENAENMGIMSLFDNFINASLNEMRQETDETPEQIALNQANNTFRESKKLNKDYENWKQLISLMRQHNESEETHIPKKDINEDGNSDGLIFLEDLQNLYLEHNMALPPLDSTDIYALNENDVLRDSGVFDKIPSQTRSVTIATASVAGLAMILFLLTYVAYKWKQSYMAGKSLSYRDQRIPTPVFEHRKGNKHNSSSRSISPMIQNPNVYTIDKLESLNRKDIPDYMWDSLRKPFQ